jgi:hypothetical protein
MAKKRKSAKKKKRRLAPRRPTGPGRYLVVVFRSRYAQAYNFSSAEAADKFFMRELKRGHYANFIKASYVDYGCFLEV